jgi:hypothetical protein
VSRPRIELRTFCEPPSRLPEKVLDRCDNQLRHRPLIRGDSVIAIRCLPLAQFAAALIVFCELNASLPWAHCRRARSCRVQSSPRSLLSLKGPRPRPVAVHTAVIVYSTSVHSAYASKHYSSVVHPVREGIFLFKHSIDPYSGGTFRHVTRHLHLHPQSKS